MDDFIILYFILGGMFLGSKLLDLPEILAKFIALICETLTRKK